MRRNIYLSLGMIVLILLAFLAGLRVGLWFRPPATAAIGLVSPMIWYPSPSASQSFNVSPTSASSAAASPIAPQATLGVLATPIPTPTLDPRGCLPEDVDSRYALVAWVRDGRSVVIDYQGKFQTVRLLGIDAPPITASKLEALLVNQVVRLLPDAPDGAPELDAYGQWLRYVLTPEGEFINYELLRSGDARLDPQMSGYACEQTFAAAQQMAQSAGVGLWGVQAARALPTPAPIAARTPQATGVRIKFIFYQGQTPGSEADEYIQIGNDGTTPVDLTGWRINAGASGQDFTFSEFTLLPGQTCRVYTDMVQDDSCVPDSFSSGTAIWANDGDCASLFDAEGMRVDLYCYTPATPSGTQIAAATTAVTTTTGGATTTTAASATPTLRGTITLSGNLVISGIYPQGDATKNESDEYIQILNQGNTAANLDGWSVFAYDSGAELYFSSFVLQPGASCRVYTNEIHNDSCAGLSFGSNEPVWANDTDCGGLYDPNEDLISEYCY
ncbi:MAG: lamin tail domain-containing protein [Anaerolineales bacterium]|nr:lamin tail domain-containing protein [Anaerolineales bacterium]